MLTGLREGRKAACLQLSIDSSADRRAYLGHSQRRPLCRRMEDCLKFVDSRGQKPLLESLQFHIQFQQFFLQD